MLDSPSSSSSREEQADTEGLNLLTLPQLPCLWCTDDFNLDPDEVSRRKRLAGVFLKPFETAEQFRDEMTPIVVHWEALMDRHKVLPPLVILRSVRAYFAHQLSPSTSPPPPKKERRERTKVCVVLTRPLMLFRHYCLATTRLRWSTVLCGASTHFIWLLCFRSQSL
jgi:hypothetical protein